ncbi:MAG: hypothetical protein GX369_08605 [Euryarchaeota archaeon]|nr:hypothetical protein [Euryarchaeota archaeon]
MTNLRLEGIYTLLSPLCHTAPEIQGQETRGDGNIIRLRTIPFNTGNFIANSYGVSGAEIRSLMKMLLVNYTLEKLELTSNDFSREVAILLYAGGMATQGVTIPKYETKEMIQQKVPLIGLFGGTINGCFFSSTLRCDFALLMSQESSKLYNNLLASQNIKIENLISINDFRPDMYRYGHARHRKPEIAHYDADSKDKIQMPYHIEAIPTGSKLVHGFSLVSPSEGDVACFKAGLKLLLDYGFLGGRSAAGYGRVSAEYFKYPSYDKFTPSTDEYDNWLSENGEDMKEILLKLNDIIESKADVQAPKACKWLMENKEELKRLFDGSHSDEDLKKMIKSTYIGNIKRFNKVIDSYRNIVLKALDNDCDGKKLYEILSSAQSGKISKFYIDLTTAAKSRTKRS